MIRSTAMRITLSICAILCLTIVGFGVYLVVQQQRRVMTLSARATGIVIDKRLDRLDRPLHQRRGETSRSVHDRFRYLPAVTFRFDANGRQFRADNVFPDPSPIGGNLGHIAASAPLDSFQVGQSVTVHYDRSNPSDACLIRRPSMLPYLVMLAPVIALSFMTVFLLSGRPPTLPAAAGDDRKRRAALGIAALWHAIGLAAAAHYLWLAGGDFGGAAVLLFAIYAQVGLIPLAIAMPPATASSPHIGRIKGAIAASLAGTFLGLFLGLLIAWIARTFFAASATTFLRCWRYTIPAVAAMFALLGLVTHWEFAVKSRSRSAE